MTDRITETYRYNLLLPSNCLPRIFVFSNSRSGEGVALAMAENGHVLGSHFCSSEYFVSGDLGLTPGHRLDRHQTYRKHYPDGYVMEFVSIAENATHPGFQAAYEKNQALAREAANDPSRSP